MQSQDLFNKKVLTNGKGEAIARVAEALGFSKFCCDTNYDDFYCIFFHPDMDMCAGNKANWKYWQYSNDGGPFEELDAESILQLA